MWLNYQKFLILNQYYFKQIVKSKFSYQQNNNLSKINKFIENLKLIKIIFILLIGFYDYN